MLGFVGLRWVILGSDGYILATAISLTSSAHYTYKELLAAGYKM
jgi:hypothetical protein